MTDELIIAEKMNFVVPFFKPSERKMSANPLKLISSLYGKSSSRESKVLLKGITFQMQREQNLGVLGQNGAGKTTLLRVLSSIYKPSSGKLFVRGKAQGLFNVKYGMNQGATGHENIYLRGLQMGLSLSEIKELIPRVIEFAEIGESIHAPFSTYSSGMQLRLALAISTMIKPDILVMDEWVGSGDAAFKEKVRKRMNKLVEDSRGLVLASHSMKLLQDTCTHGIVLHHGQQKFFGPIDEATDYYSEKILKKTRQEVLDLD